MANSLAISWPSLPKNSHSMWTGYPVAAHLVLRGEMSAEDVLETYAGVAWDDLTPEEKQGIEDYSEMGISDVLTARANVAWGWSGRDEGSHTATQVPVFAFGPGSEEIEDGTIDNTEIGVLLLESVDGN